MSDSNRRFFSGDTLQQALVQAANHYHLQPEEIAYHQIEKRHGFTKVRRKVVIEVDPAAPQQTVVRPVAEPRPPAARAMPPAAQAMPPPAPPAPLAPNGAEATAAAVPAAAGGERNDDRGGHGRPRAAERRPAGGERGAGPRRGGGGRGGGHEPRRHDSPGDAGRERRPSGAYTRDRRPSQTAMVGLSSDGVAEDLVALPERSRSVAERFPAAEGPQAEAAAKGVELLLRIAGLTLVPRIFQGEERLEIDLAGADSDWCFADDGELLMAIEHLLPRVIRSLSGEAVLCRVDCDNFHEIREERLRSLAQRVADEVRLRGRPRTLVPMNPADRRIIHVTLADDPAVVTESEGDGYFKRITVRLA
jgi:predicted RNA-binding protein Jag